MAKFWPRLSRYFLVGFTCILWVSAAHAQTPPDNVWATWAGGHAVNVYFVACQTSAETNCACPVNTTVNCYPSNDFSIYRNPPGFTQLLTAGPEDATVYQHTYLDTTVKPGQTYTYKVCGGGYADSDSSNCRNTNAVTVPIPPPPPPPPPQTTVTLSASPMVVQPGQSTTLRWTSTNATNVIMQPNTVTGLPLSGTLATNPSQTTTYTMYAFGPYGNPKSSITVGVGNLSCPPFAPPQGLLDAPYSGSLKWTNPTTSPNTPYQTCPSSPTDILVYRGDSGGYQELADLAANNGVHSDRYNDPGPVQPHSSYTYAVCEGVMSGPTPSPNCASLSVFTWGASPVLWATRRNATAVRLVIAVDQFSVSSINVTRVGSDDPCYQQAGAQGINLGSGRMGCRTVGPNGPIAAHPVPVYNWTYTPGVTPNWTFNSKSAPWVIDLPDDTPVKSGVEYYYHLEVGWSYQAGGSPESLIQDSADVTVPVFNPMLVEQHLTVVGGIQPLKRSGGGSSPSQSRATAMPTMAPAARPASPVMHPLASAIAPPQQAVTAARPMMTPMTTPTTPMLQPAQPMMSSVRPAAPPVAQSATRARLTIPPITTAHTTPSVRSAAPSPDAANLVVAIKEVQQKPRDAQALYALGKAYCASHLTNTGVSYMYMALLLAEQSGNAALATQIKGSLAAEGASLAKKP